MIIRNMFAEDIDRPINGVIKVDQDEGEVLYQEVKEYVITKELKKHFLSFFNYYSEAFDRPTADVGVWISGFFGSGKSHFLKMLSYLLANRAVQGKQTVEYFREKFIEDPATFMMIDRSTRAKTETILFNIDIEGPMQKDKTAVLRVFAKMFYKHLGFCGENLKTAMLEKYIDEQGKTEEFRRVFAEKKGQSWESQRKGIAFNGKSLIPTLMEVLDMSEEDAKRWFNDKSAVELSIAQLVEDIKSYVNKQPADFRLLFMIDEVGQYVGTDTDMLLNLQSLTEKLGSECMGKVWVVCTGQEAIDEIIKVRADEFSRIQARFKTRLSLSSSSVDEVIQKRVLKKNDAAERLLEQVYNENHAVLRNLFSFTNSVLDIKGYSGPVDFTINYPFVPYQMIVMQKIFSEIRKHGNAGKHLAGGERSMLSGFQEAAQRYKEKNEYTLVPLFQFYDTIQSFLDSSIRRVIDRCQKAADNHDGIEAVDVSVLKLLYLVRYVDDIPANLDNIVILMAESIHTDKIIAREEMRKSLDRLLSQNYIGRSGDVYNFLTDEEQDIQREINSTPIDTATIVEKIGQMIYGDIFTTKKFRFGKYDFAFDQMVDGVMIGAATGGMRLRFLTDASDPQEKDKFRLMTTSKGKEAICVLADSLYFESLERALKIRKFVKQKNVPQLPKSVQEIIRGHLDEATRYEMEAKDQLKKAIESGIFYADGECLDIRGGDAKSKIEQALEYLVEHVYNKLNLVVQHVESDQEIAGILAGGGQMTIDGAGNADAAAEVEEYLDIQAHHRLPTSMSDIQSKFSAIPYGWKEIDIAAVVALLIYEQKVTVKYSGNTIQPTDSRLVDMLRKKSEIAKTQISKRVAIAGIKIKQVREFLREYFDVMDVPDDEDGLVRFIVEKFEGQKTHYDALFSKYESKNYPDKSLVATAIQLMKEVLDCRKDNTALIDKVLQKKDDLFDNHDDMARVESFFANQVALFDTAVRLESEMKNDLHYLEQDSEGKTALNTLHLIITVEPGRPFNYTRIPQLNELISKVRSAHDILLEAKRAELYEVIRSCMSTIHQTAGESLKCKETVKRADDFYQEKKHEIGESTSLAILDGMILRLWQYRDDTISRLEKLLQPEPEVTVSPTAPAKPTPKKNYKPIYRQEVFPAKVLETEEDIDAYLENVRKSLKQLLANTDGIKLN